MEIIEKKIVIKLDEDERESLMNTMELLNRMNYLLSTNCKTCPFFEICQKRSNDFCFFELIETDLKYINNNCD